MRKKWTQEEISFLKENINKLSIKELSEKLNRNGNSISGFISSNAIKKDIILLNGEEIKEIFSGRYFITSYGRVFNHLHKEIKQFDSDGYKRITLSIEENKKKKFFVHRLVAENFLEKIDGKNFVNHKGMNRINNHKDNLEWVNSSENEKHKLKMKPELKINLSLVNSTNENETKKNRYEEIKNICYKLNDGLSISEISKELNISQKRISAIKNKRLWKKISDKYLKN